MASPASDLFWTNFTTDHGLDSEELKAFLGYLTTHEVDPGGDPGDLQAAYDAFHAWMTESYGKDASESEAANAQHLAQAREAGVDETPRPVIPKSSIANPDNEKSAQAATRPPDLRPPPEDPATARGSAAASSATSSRTPTPPPSSESSAGSGRSRAGSL